MAKIIEIELQPDDPIFSEGVTLSSHKLLRPQSKGSSNSVDKRTGEKDDQQTSLAQKPKADT